MHCGSFLASACGGFRFPGLRIPHPRADADSLALCGSISQAHDDAIRKRLARRDHLHVEDVVRVSAPCRALLARAPAPRLLLVPVGLQVALDEPLALLRRVGTADEPLLVPQLQQRRPARLLARGLRAEEVVALL